MSAAARSRVCNSVSAWTVCILQESLCHRRSRRRLIVFAGYFLLLFFVSSEAVFIDFINRCSKHVV